MKTALLKLAAALAATTAVAVGLIDLAVASDAAPVQPTTSTVIRPLSAAGTPAPGYRIVDRTTQAIDCSAALPSPAAVDPNIKMCFPTSADALACWRGYPGTALCLATPLGDEIDRYRVGAFGHVTARAHRVPMELVLNQGTPCLLRDGGVWDDADGHPTWAGSYACEGPKPTYLYGPSANAGIDVTTNPWTVHQIHGRPGHQIIRSVTVDRAYYIGTSPDRYRSVTI